MVAYGYRMHANQCLHGSGLDSHVGPPLYFRTTDLACPGTYLASYLIDKPQEERRPSDRLVHQRLIDGESPVRLLNIDSGLGK